MCFDIGKLVRTACSYAVTLSNATDLKNTEITNCDIEVFKGHDFLTADVTGDLNILVHDESELVVYEVDIVAEEKQLLM